MIYGLLILKMNEEEEGGITRAYKAGAVNHFGICVHAFSDDDGSEPVNDLSRRGTHREKESVSILVRVASATGNLRVR